MTDIENATVEDWLGLMPLLQGQGWRMRGSVIRNKRGECPLCALATKIGVNNGFTEVYGLAWGLDSVFPCNALSDIADAADDAEHLLRLRLMAALGMAK